MTTTALRLSPGVAEALAAGTAPVTTAPVQLVASPEQLGDAVLPAGVRLAVEVDDPARGGTTRALRGSACVASASWTAVTSGTSEVVDVATVASERGRGLGAAVTAAAVDGARRGGADLVWLTVASSGAERLYRRLGFRDG